MGTRGRRPRARGGAPLASGVVAALLVGAVLAGCSSDGSDGASPASEATRTTAAAKATSTTEDLPAAADTEPEAYDGPVAGFYEVPDPLPPGRPGDLIRVQPISDDATTAVVRVMYHSRDARDRDRAVTGTIAYPKAEAPADGWPVVSWAHGTAGLSSSCAPSRAPEAGVGPDFGVRGVRVATDYLGLGPVGERHPYLSGLSEGHSVIDAVRAARDLPAAHAGTRWVAAGHSQGGHAALWTNELGQAYAPELQLLGTAALAPAAVLPKTFGPDDQVVPRMVGIMALYGIAADDPEIDPHDYVGDEVRSREAVIDDACSDAVINALVGIPAATFYAHDPKVTEPAKSALVANDPGHKAVDAPLLLVYGSADTYVVPKRAEYLFDQLCDVGQVTESVEVDGATHGSVIGLSAARIGTWFQARFAGDEPTDSCPPG
ncbi:lipase family protein [Aquihabitans sp. G128]|uniref:lipase family protein n=1 Tax=Aquihabitans sp. G128 TaxID=2849779 RepID=UPI001C21C912|nr:lipase family protein [Aquihabitans sp. G128]QXC62644.1 lipase family protein [Aquihabitans sp. G128]